MMIYAVTLASLKKVSAGSKKAMAKQNGGVTQQGGVTKFKKGR